MNNTSPHLSRRERDWFCRFGIVLGLPLGALSYAQGGWVMASAMTLGSLVFTVGAYSWATWKEFSRAS